jgi:hypothetical protein
MNLNEDRIAPSPQPSPPMGAREKTSQVMRFMGSKREGFIRRILSQRERAGVRGKVAFASPALGFSFIAVPLTRPPANLQGEGKRPSGEFLWPQNSLKRSNDLTEHKIIGRREFS